MSGLAHMAASYTVPTATGSKINILDELGITRQKKIFSQRTLALVDPEQYNRDRDRQFDRLSIEVDNAYKTTMAGLRGSGLSSVEIQQMAIQAAASTYDTQHAILETDFPSGSTLVALQSEAKDSFPGMLSTPTITTPVPRRAPARKRKAVAKKK